MMITDLNVFGATVEGQDSARLLLHLGCPPFIVVPSLVDSPTSSSRR